MQVFNCVYRQIGVIHKVALKARVMNQIILFVEHFSVNLIAGFLTLWSFCGESWNIHYHYVNCFTSIPVIKQTLC